MKPCFVLMPFGRKTIHRATDFDAVTNLIHAIAAAGGAAAGGREAVGGMIHKPMYERLIL